MGKTLKQALSSKQLEMITTIKDSGVINFDQVGKIVSQITPALFDPGIAADDYVVKGVDSVIHIYKLRDEFAGLEDLAALKRMGEQIRTFE